jgi:predicted CoA-binding protein
MPGRLIDNHIEFDRLLPGLRRIAVLGIKPESRADRPAHIVPAYLHRAGFEVLPVPVYYPDVTEILGQRVYRRVSDIPGRVDLVSVFRKPQDLVPHLDDLVAARPRTVWLQTGIRNDGFARSLLDAGIDVVQDECLMVEHRRWRSSR